MTNANYVTAPAINKENQVTYFTEAAFTFAANDLPKYRAAINRTGGPYASAAYEWCRQPACRARCNNLTYLFFNGWCMNGDGPIASLASFSNSRTLEAGVTYFRSPFANRIYHGFWSEYSKISDFNAYFSVLFIK